MKRIIAIFLFLIAFGCSTASVDRAQPRRVVGTENSVRVDAEIFGEEVSSGSNLAITYEVTNQRAATIAIADILPVTSWDPDSNTITVDIGSEVPGEFLLPRLMAVAPGETKVFTTSARIAFAMPRRSADPLQRTPAAALRLRISFLGDVEPFRPLLEMTEKAMADRTLADAMFPLWIERNEVLTTSSVPMRWSSTRDRTMATPQRPPVRGRWF